MAKKIDIETYYYSPQNLMIMAKKGIMVKGLAETLREEVQKKRAEESNKKAHLNMEQNRKGYPIQTGIRKITASFGTEPYAFSGMFTMMNYHCGRERNLNSFVRTNPKAKEGGIIIFPKDYPQSILQKVLPAILSQYNITKEDYIQGKAFTGNFTYINGNHYDKDCLSLEINKLSPMLLRAFALNLAVYSPEWCLLLKDTTQEVYLALGNEILGFCDKTTKQYNSTNP